MRLISVLTPRRVGVAGGVFVLAGVLGIGAAFAYDRSQRDVIAQGVRVDTIDLGGLSAAEARARLERRLAPLERPLVLRYPGGRVVITPRAASLSVESGAVVERALAVSRRSWFLPRAWRYLTGSDVDASLRPVVSFSPGAVGGAVRTIRERANRPPRNATVVPSARGLTVLRSRPGQAVSMPRLWHAIASTLYDPRASRVIEVPLVKKQPRTSLGDLRRKYPSFITIDRAAFTLRLFKNLRYVKRYSIAVGQQGLETPAGLYHIQDKSVNPSWQVPNSAWAGSLAGQLIPPGPDDPIKARWMGIFNGAGIHGTDETWSIGHAVSHGCVRMTIPDVIDLYDRVQVGTPVYIGD
jgi:lipoprotein-anchoring transpeptidase ErfK/SrfK